MVIFTFILSGCGEPVVGKAVDFIQKSNTLAPNAASQTANLNFLLANAPPDETFNLKLTVDTGELLAKRVSFKVILDPRLQISGSPKAASGSPWSSTLSSVEEKRVCNPGEECGESKVWAFFKTGTGVKGLKDVANIPLKVVCDNCKDEKLQLTLKDIQISKGEEGEGAVQLGDLIATVNVVDKCIDLDGDGYGAEGTDLRGCTKPGSKEGTIQFQFDCDDIKGSGEKTYPGATEICDGKDNNCDKIIEDEKLPGAPNEKKLQGVCFGKQICEGGKWEESYLVKNDKNLNTFSGVDGIPIKQYTLYEETETKCDFFDNDCDGNVNKGLKDCKIGGDGVAGEAQIIKENHPGFILGNAIFDYQTGKDELATEQKVNAKDKDLISYLIQIEDAVKAYNIKVKSDPNTKKPSGTKDQIPLYEPFKSGSIWFCNTDKYYDQGGENQPIYLNDGKGNKKTDGYTAKGPKGTSLYDKNDVLVIC